MAGLLGAGLISKKLVESGCWLSRARMSALDMSGYVYLRIGSIEKKNPGYLQA